MKTYIIMINGNVYKQSCSNIRVALKRAIIKYLRSIEIRKRNLILDILWFSEKELRI